MSCLKQLKISALAFTWISLSGCNLFEPNTYDDCILKYTKANQNEAAVRQIKKSCEAKYAQKVQLQKFSRELTAEERKRLSGKGGEQSYNIFGGPVYNGNEKLTISQITIQVETKSSGKSEEHEYQIIVYIPPLSSTNISFPFLSGDLGTKAIGKIIKAEGFEQ